MEETQPTSVQVAPITKRDGSSSLKRFNKALTGGPMQSYLQEVLGARKEQFVNNLLSVVANEPKLQVCLPTSLIYAATKATALGLPIDPNLGFAYIIPYKSTKKAIEVQNILDAKTGAVVQREVTVETQVKEAQFQLGYKGFVQLALRTGQFAKINTSDVREGEYKGTDLITGDIRIEAVPDRESKPIVGYLAYFALTNGFSKMLYMSVDEIKAHAQKYSQTYGSKLDYVRASSKWTTDFEAMAKKTVLKLLLSKYAPLSVDVQGMSQLQQALKEDQAVIDDQGEAKYLDNPENNEETGEVAEEQQPAEVATPEEKKEALKEKKAGGKAEKAELF